MMEEIINRRYSIKEQDFNQQIKEEEFKNKLKIEIDNEYTKVRETEEKNKEEEEKSKELPDLIVIDGGKGHLNISLKTLKKMDLEKLECISLSLRKMKKYFYLLQKDPLSLPKNKKELKILQHIRDESHRFGLDV